MSLPVVTNHAIARALRRWRLSSEHEAVVVALCVVQAGQPRPWQSRGQKFDLEVVPGFIDTAVVKDGAVVTVYRNKKKNKENT